MQEIIIFTTNVVSAHGMQNKFKIWRHVHNKITSETVSGDEDFIFVLLLGGLSSPSVHWIYPLNSGTVPQSATALPGIS